MLPNTKAYVWLFLVVCLFLTACTTAESVAEPPRKSVVVLWNEVMLAAVRKGSPKPTIVTRSLFMVHTAMYDAWSMYDDTAVPVYTDPSLKRPRREHTLTNKTEAVSYAAYHMLVELFPEYEANTMAFQRLLENLGYEVLLARDTVTPVGIGQAAAQAVLIARLNDGSNAGDNFADMLNLTYGTLYVAVNSDDPADDRGIRGQNFDPNRWQPLRVPTGKTVDSHGNPIVDDEVPSSYVVQSFLTPHWGAVKPFALTAGNQFRPEGPPQYGLDLPYVDALGQEMTHDEAYRLQFTQVLSYSSHLSDRQKVVAEYWADGPRSETPPGHWNALAHGISFRDQNTIDEDIKMFFALNAAVFDGGIAAWDAKRAFDYIRPQTAIRFLFDGEEVDAWGGPDRGTQIIDGSEWQPYQDLKFVTPPFPEFISGHSTFSAAAAEVLTRFTGSNQFYDGVTMLDEDFNSDGLPDMLGEHVVIIGGNMFEGSPHEVITLRWPTFQDAADEAGISRLYGGIHIQDSDLRGRRVGRLVGEQAYLLAEQYWNGSVKN